MVTAVPLDRAPRRRRRRDPRITLCDGFGLTIGGTVLKVPVASQRVIAFAALQHEPQRRTAVSRAVWPHLDEPGGSLRVALSRLRRINTRVLQSSRTHVMLAPRVRVDAWDLEERATDLIAGVARDSAELSVPTLLPDWDDDWVIVERERLRELCMHAIEAEAKRLTREGRYTQAITTIFHALRADPLRDSAMRALLAIHLAEGNRVQAVREFLDFRERLLDEMGIEPSAAMLEMMASTRPR